MAIVSVMKRKLDIKYEDIIREFDDLSFLSTRWDSNTDGHYKSYYINGTYYIVIVNREVGGTTIEYFSMKNILHSVSFEEVFEQLSEEIKEIIIFNLELFGWINGRNISDST